MLEATVIRRKAEELMKAKISAGDSKLSEADSLKIIQELEVHQIELELQNEELLQTRSAANEAAEKYTQLYEFAPTSYFTLSKEGIINNLNQCGLQMLGKERSSLGYIKFNNFISSDTKPVFDLFFENLFCNKTKESCEVTMSIDENPPLFVYIFGIITKKSEECLLSVIDITERKLAIQTIIEQQRLGAIGEMASSIAHDFNNSLQSIVGNLELAMNSQELLDSALRYLKNMKTIVSDAAARVQQLQRFGGKSQGRKKYLLINLNTLITEVIAQLRPLWKDEPEKRGLTVTVDTEFDEIPQVCGNDNELRTVFYNIIKNSLEAMPEGGCIFVKSGSRADGVFVTITDTGVGMNEDTKSRVFQPFYSTKGTNVGRGLGMSSVFSIIKEHKGNIYVKNTSPGNGTTIEFIIPISQKKATEDTEGTGVGDITSTSAANPVVRVLWVEDDESINLIACEMIKFLGHTGNTVSSGKEALALLEKNSYDIVITDIGMPEMNGWQLAEIIKEKYYGKMKVAVVSGWGSQITENEKMKYGVECVMSKPFNMSQLQKLLSLAKGK